MAMIRHDIPVELWDRVYEALKSRPSPYGVPASQLASHTYKWTREALEGAGVTVTQRDLETAAWSDRIIDIFDQTTYFSRRHMARASRKGARR